jgi:mannose-1-phosphate guanylyltransferase
MVPADFAWSDIGSWDAVADLWPRDAHGNSSRDPVIALDSRNNLVATHGKPVALVGVEGLAVVDSGDAILVCRRECAQDVRAVVSALDAAGLGALK